jgi:hypothetical protein
MPPDPSAEMDARLGAVAENGLRERQGAPGVPAGQPKPAKRGSSLAARFDIGAGYLFANAEVNRRMPMDCWSSAAAARSTGSTWPTPCGSS